MLHEQAGHAFTFEILPPRLGAICAVQFEEVAVVAREINGVGRGNRFAVQRPAGGERPSEAADLEMDGVEYAAGRALRWDPVGDRFGAR